MDVWDHTQDPSVDSPLTTITLDPNNRQRPDKEMVFEVMDSEAETELPSQAASMTGRGATILREMAKRDVQKYDP